MAQTDSFPLVREKTGAPTTVSAGRSLEIAQQPIFRSEEVISEHNRRDADQTQSCNINGTTNALPINPIQRQLLTPPLADVREFFRAMQKWQGHVTQVGKDTFSARLTPLVGEGPEQEAEIYAQDVDQDDRTLIELGAVFYWSIGYLDRPSGRLRASIIRFRRLPVWTKSELEKADTEAAKLRSLLYGQ